jgi:hypothetical protein
VKSGPIDWKKLKHCLAPVWGLSEPIRERGCSLKKFAVLGRSFNGVNCTFHLTSAGRTPISLWRCGS